MFSAPGEGTSDRDLENVSPPPSSRHSKFLTGLQSARTGRRRDFPQGPWSTPRGAYARSPQRFAVLALAVEDPDAVRGGVRAALADCESFFRGAAAPAASRRPGRSTKQTRHRPRCHRPAACVCLFGDQCGRSRAPWRTIVCKVEGGGEETLGADVSFRGEAEVGQWRSPVPRSQLVHNSDMAPASGRLQPGWPELVASWLSRKRA